MPGSGPLCDASRSRVAQTLTNPNENGRHKEVLEAARKSGARKAVRLDVSEPSHCRLLQPVADTLTKSLRALPLHEPKSIYVGNVTGTLRMVFAGTMRQPS
jgi:malonyl CoA-acyl carrier protein transacylase